MKNADLHPSSLVLQTFFQKFDLFADAPDTVAKMRRFILDLAVQGKLVAQDPKDEPADELLKRVQAEKARLVKSGEIKKQEQLPPVSEDAIPFSLPGGWAASQLGDVAVCLDYMREPINGTERDLRIAGKTQDELFPYYGATQQQGWIDDFIFDAELVLLGEDGVPFFDALRSKAYLISGKTWVNNHAHVFRGILVSNPYLMHWLNVFDYTGRVAGSTRSKLNQAKAVDIPIALPPLAEQRRIVAKVDELMALCDRMEAQQLEREAQAGQLARASLARFTDAPTPANLNHLFHSSFPISPSDLRKSILTLAVQGKLLPQDAESSFLSLESILAEASVNGVSKGPTFDKSATEILRISAGTSRGDFYVNEDDFKHVDLPPDEVEKFQLAPGDLLACRFNGNLHYVGRFSYYRGESGRVQVNPDKLIRFRIKTESHCPRYVCLAMNAAPTREAIEAMCATTAGNIGLSAGRLKTVEIPIPPLAEQRRIVAKVSELMALVDELETQLAASRAAAEKLLSALVAELTVTTSRLPVDS